jgi:hypothetical protein
MPALDILMFFFLSQRPLSSSLSFGPVSLLLPASLTSQRSTNLGSGLALMRTDRQTEKFHYLIRTYDR